MIYSGSPQHTVKKAAVHGGELFSLQVTLLMLIVLTAFFIVAVNPHQSQLDQRFSLASLTKFEYGRHPIHVLSQLQPLKLRQMKRKAVFNMKRLDDLLYGSRDAAIALYIKSWLEDESAGCSPTWRNLLVILSDIGLGDVAMEILKVMSESCSPMITTAGRKLYSV